MTRASWFTTSYAEDAWRTKQDPPKEQGDGRVYVVRNIHGEYLCSSHNGFSWWSTSKKLAKRFYDGQAAWGAASKSIYPAEVIVVRGKDKVGE